METQLTITLNELYAALAEHEDRWPAPTQDHKADHQALWAMTRSADLYLQGVSFFRDDTAALIERAERHAAREPGQAGGPRHVDEQADADTIAVLAREVARRMAA